MSGANSSAKRLSRMGALNWMKKAELPREASISAMVSAVMDCDDSKEFPKCGKLRIELAPTGCGDNRCMTVRWSKDSF